MVKNGDLHKHGSGSRLTGWLEVSSIHKGVLISGGYLLVHSLYNTILMLVFQSHQSWLCLPPFAVFVFFLCNVLGKLLSPSVVTVNSKYLSVG